MAFSESTGQLILRAAQGLSQTIQVQKQMQARQAEREATMAIEVSNLQARNERDKTEAEIQRLKLEREQFLSSPDALDRARRKSEADIARTKAETTQTTLENDVLRRGGGKDTKEFQFEAEANYDTGLQRTFQERLQQKGPEWGIENKTTAFNSTRFPGTAVPINPLEEFKSLGGLNNVGRDSANRALDQARRDFSDFMDKHASALASANPQRKKQFQEMAVRLEARVDVAKKVATSTAELTTEFTSRQLRERGAQVRGPEAELNERLFQLEESRRSEFSQAFGGLGAPVVERLQADIIGDKKTDIVAFLRSNGIERPTRDNPKWNAFGRYVNILMSGDTLKTKDFLQSIENIYRR